MMPLGGFRAGRCRGIPSKGFTLFELLIVLAIVAILWGLGITSMPRLLSGSGPDSLARRLAGSGQEARQMAMLQQRPWEVLLDLDQGVYYRAPLGAVERRELRAFGEPGDGSIDPASRSGLRRQGEKKEEDLIASRQEELGREAYDRHGLRTRREYDIRAFAHDDSEGDIFESAIPEEVKILQVWRQGGHSETSGRVRLVFGPRGFVQPTALWFEDAEQPGEGRHTLYFPGMLPPVVLRGIFLPDIDGALAPVDLPR